MLFQPSLPYKLSDTTNLFIRPAIPVIFNQDVPVPIGGFNSEGVDLGDISFDASLGTTLPGGFVVLGGLACGQAALVRLRRSVRFDAAIERHL